MSRRYLRGNTILRYIARIDRSIGSNISQLRCHQQHKEKRKYRSKSF